MCIIVYKPKHVAVDRRILETCFENNPDGAGFMYPADGRVVVRKGYFTFDAFRAAWDKVHALHGDALPVVFHFRIATAGRIDALNCHPHRIADDLAFVHNGVLSRIDVPKGGALSDTIIYRNRYFGKMTGRALRNKPLLDAIARHIGAGNKFAFMNGGGEVAICNERQGVWKDGLWFSNNSFQPRRRFPNFLLNDSWLCERCGRFLHTPKELAEGVCLDCLDAEVFDFVECNGCYIAMKNVTCNVPCVIFQ